MRSASGARLPPTTARRGPEGKAPGGSPLASCGRYPLQADDVNRLWLGGAWMASESSETPDFVIVGHAESYLWARVSEKGGARLRSSFPEIGRPVAGGLGEWILAPHIAADTGRQAE